MSDQSTHPFLELRMRVAIREKLAEQPGGDVANLAAAAVIEALTAPEPVDEAVLIDRRVISAIWSTARQVVVPTFAYLKKAGLIGEES